MNRAEGLSSKKYGIMVHYLYGLQNGKRVYSSHEVVIPEGLE